MRLIVFARCGGIRSLPVYQSDWLSFVLYIVEQMYSTIFSTITDKQTNKQQSSTPQHQFYANKTKTEGQKQQKTVLYMPLPNITVN